jgi:hypothetical protein
MIGFVAWTVQYYEEFWAELKAESESLQDAVFANAVLLQHSGPQLRRPYADTLKGSAFPFHLSARPNARKTAGMMRRTYRPR